MARRKTRITSIDVAKRAGVSQPAVSRAFTPGSSITKDKRDRILNAAKELGYVPNVFASALSSSRSNMVAVINGNMNNPFYSESLQTFIEQLQLSGRQVLAFSVQEGQDSDDVLMQALRYPVDGIVVTSAQMSSDLIGLSEGLGIPIVMFNRRVRGLDLASVSCDNIHGCHILADHLYQRGARRFLVVRGDPQGSTSADRTEGFRKALDHLGPCQIQEIDGGSSYSGAKRAILNQFADPNFTPPDAVFAVNDIMAMGCLDALRGPLGLRVPQDILLAGFDGIREAQRPPYSLTTMRQPIEDMVQSTLSILDLGKVEPDAPSPSAQLLPGELLIGKTTQ